MVFQPGQFVMVKPSGSLDPFLPRAYSILRVRPPARETRGSVIEILYKVVGKGTTALSHLKP
jgi:NAD(P)H-flavin reductase